MFDKNLEDFVKSVGLSKVSEIVLNCPEGFDKYLKSSGTYTKRSKQLCYNTVESIEIEVTDATTQGEESTISLNKLTKRKTFVSSVDVATQHYTPRAEGGFRYQREVNIWTEVK